MSPANALWFFFGFVSAAIVSAVMEKSK